MYFFNKNWIMVQAHFVDDKTYYFLEFFLIIWWSMEGLNTGIWELVAVSTFISYEKQENSSVLQPVVKAIYVEIALKSFNSIFKKILATRSAFCELIYLITITMGTHAQVQDISMLGNN